MTRTFQKLGHCVLLAVFSALSASGPGLHYLPVFGLHAEHCSAEIETHCDHAHSHGHQESHEDHVASAVSADLGTDHRHGQCHVCDLYAQSNAVSPEVASLSHFDLAIGEVTTEVGQFASQRLTDHLARGPPLSV